MKYLIFITIIIINTLSACAVCYGGAPDDPVTMGMNKAIFFLLSTIIFVLSCISYGIISLIRRTNQIKIEELK